MSTPERRAILTLATIIEQQLQMTNLVVHATHREKFDTIRKELGEVVKPHNPAAMHGAFVPEGPGCAVCGRRPEDLIANGHGPHPPDQP